MRQCRSSRPRQYCHIRIEVGTGRRVHQQRAQGKSVGRCHHSWCLRGFHRAVTATRPRLSDGCFFGNSDEYGDVNTAPAPSAGSSREKSERGRGDGDTLCFVPRQWRQRPVMSIIAMKQDRHLAQAVHVMKDLLRNSSVIVRLIANSCTRWSTFFVLISMQPMKGSSWRLWKGGLQSRGWGGFQRRTLTPPMVLHMSSHELSCWIYIHQRCIIMALDS